MVPELSLNQFHQLAFDRREYRPQFMPALQYRATLAHERPHALPVAQVGSLFDPIFRTFRRASECAEHRSIAAKVDGIITPVSCCDHATVEVQNLGKFNAVETNLI